MHVSAHGDQMYGLNLLKWPLKVKMFKTYLVWLLGVHIEGFFVQCVHVINCTVFGQGVISHNIVTHVFFALVVAKVVNIAMAF